MGGHVIDVTNSIDCDVDCTKTLPINTQVTLEAVPDSGYSFLKWEDGSTNVRHTLIVMDRNINVNAIFMLSAATQYTLTIIRGGTDKGTIVDTANGINWTVGTLTKIINAGTDVNLSIIPKTDFVLYSWIEGDIVHVTSPFPTFQMNSDITFQPRFNYTGTNSVTFWIEFVGGVVHGVINDDGNDIHCSTHQQSFTYPSGTIITLVATANAGYTFVHWNNDPALTNTTIIGTLVIPTTVYATFASAFSTPVTLTFNKNLAIGGTVADAGGSFACGLTCTTATHSYALSITLQIVITPNTGYRIDKIDGVTYPITATSIQRIIKYLVIGGVNQTCDVEFIASSQATLTIIRGDTDKGTIVDVANSISQITDIHTYLITLGTYVNLSVIPKTDFELYSWIDGDLIHVTSPFPQFQMTTDIIFQPRFNYIGVGYTLWVGFNDGSGIAGSGVGLGIVRDDPNQIYFSTQLQSHNFEPNIYLNLTAEPVTGFAFVQWEYNGTIVNTNPLSFQLTTSTAVVVVFTSAYSYVLTIIRGGINKGTIYESTYHISQTINVVPYNIPYNAPVNLYVVPASGYDFLSWIDGDPICTLSYPQFLMTADKTFQPRFIKTKAYGDVKLTILFAGGIANGIIGDSVEETYCTVNNQSFYFVPGTVMRLYVIKSNPGYSFSSWTGGSTSLTLTPFTLNTDTTITATFTTGSSTSCILTINIVNPTHGSVTDSGNSINVSNSVNIISLPSGTKVNLKAVPIPGFNFINWETYSGDPDRPEFTLTADKTVTATFELY